MAEINDAEFDGEDILVTIGWDDSDIQEAADRLAESIDADDLDKVVEKDEYGRWGDWTVKATTHFDSYQLKQELEKPLGDFLFSDIGFGALFGEVMERNPAEVEQGWEDHIHESAADYEVEGWHHSDPVVTVRINECVKPLVRPVHTVALLFSIQPKAGSREHAGSQAAVREDLLDILSRFVPAGFDEYRVLEIRNIT